MSSELFINKACNEFYNYMSQIYIEYNIEKAKREEIKLEEAKLEEIKTITKPIGSFLSFIDYFLFKLYYNYGVKRRMANEHIAVLYYVKSLKGYKPNSIITMLCRHMMLDIRNMRIISLGIPKSYKLDEFCSLYDINKTDAQSNSITNKDDSITNKFTMYKFPEGTMMTYNPSLKSNNITVVSTTISSDDIDEIDDTNNTNTNNTNNNEEGLKEGLKEQLKEQLITENIEIKFNKQFAYSTRSVVGTGRFSSLKTFSEMFEENNSLSSTNIDSIPEEIIKDTVLVFNIEHPDNCMLSKNTRNFNTLCAVFKFKLEELSQSQYNDIVSITYSPEAEQSIRDAFTILGTNMITYVDVNEYNNKLSEFGVSFNLPEVVYIDNDTNDTNDTNDNSSTNTESSNELYINKTFEYIDNKVNNEVNNAKRDFKGYIIYGCNGERSKFTNKQYKEICNLKGNKPIVVEPWNIKNLFFLYYRLKNEGKIEQFLKEFDEQSDVGSNKHLLYIKLFNWFFTLIRNYSMNLFRIYHLTFVKKTLIKQNIPYSMKPMCGDLHNEYMKNKIPTTNLMVDAYIFSQKPTKIFWRLFLDDKSV